MGNLDKPQFLIKTTFWATLVKIRLFYLPTSGQRRVQAFLIHCLKWIRIGQLLHACIKVHQVKKLSILLRFTQPIWTRLQAESKRKLSRWLGSSCGSVGRVVATDTRDPWFESSHRKNFLFRTFVYYRLYWKDKNKEKEAVNGPFFLKKTQDGQIDNDNVKTFYSISSGTPICVKGMLSKVDTRGIKTRRTTISEIIL